MEEHLTDIHTLEHEVGKLKASLTSSLAVLDGLARIQDQFQGLQASKQQLEACLGEAQTLFDQLRTALAAGEERLVQTGELWSQRYTDLAATNEAHWIDYNNQVLDVQNQLNTAHRNLRAELGTEVNKLKREVEGGLEILRSDWANLEATLATRFDAVETRFATEWETATAQLTQQRAETQQQFEALAEQDRIARLALDSLRRQTRILRDALVIALVAAVVTLGLVVWQFL